MVTEACALWPSTSLIANERAATQERAQVQKLLGSLKSRQIQQQCGAVGAARQETEGTRARWRNMRKREEQTRWNSESNAKPSRIIPPKAFFHGRHRNTSIRDGEAKERARARAVVTLQRKQATPDQGLGPPQRRSPPVGPEPQRRSEGEVKVRLRVIRRRRRLTTARAGEPTSGESRIEEGCRHEREAPLAFPTLRSVGPFSSNPCRSSFPLSPLALLAPARLVFISPLSSAATLDGGYDHARNDG